MHYCVKDSFSSQRPTRYDEILMNILQKWCTDQQSCYLCPETCGMRLLKQNSWPNVIGIVLSDLQARSRQVGTDPNDQ
jgi:hypothetical protein